MKKTYLASIFLILVSIAFISCNKEEGPGGTATIEGFLKLVLHPDDNYNLDVDTVAATKTDVFIVYGSDIYFGDDIETDDKGFYRFKYLEEGNYTVFSYTTMPSGEKIAVSENVSIDKGETCTVPTIYIHEGKALGTSIVKGSVWATYLKKGDVVGEGWAYEHRVYIKRIDEDYHFDDVRVGEEGVFMFQKLEPGTYEIFTPTEDIYEIPSIIKQEITIDSSGVIYELPEIFNVQINV